MGCIKGKSTVGENCCCSDCAHDKIAGQEDCPECCKCVPRRLCVTFYPDDIDWGHTSELSVHDGDGTYSLGAFNTQVSIIFGEYDYEAACVWHVEISSIGYVGDFPIADYGCLLTLQNIEIPGITLGGQIGTLEIKPASMTRIPVDVKTENCYKRVCANCLCFPTCACLRYNIEFFSEDEEDPYGPPINEGSIRRLEWTCWDPDVGQTGGWFVSFDHLDCSPDISLTFEIVDEYDDGLCYMKVEGGPFDGTDLQLITCDSISNSWSFASSLPHPVTGYSGDVLITVSITSEFCNDCLEQCCTDLPDTLVATLESPDCTIDPVEITLQRQECHGVNYLGEIDLDWNCPDEGPGTGHAFVSFNCQDCKVNPNTQVCECECEGDEDPGIAGCHRIVQFTLDEWDPVGGSIGNQFNKTSRCGLFGITPVAYFSTCNPIFAQFVIPVQGIAGCCDEWNITITKDGVYA